MTRSLSTKATVLAGLLALVASLSGTCAGQDLVVRVPFDFRAGENHFGPGEYVLALDGAPGGSVTIRSADRGRSAVVHVRKSSAAGGKTMSTVSFRAYGDSRFLSAIQVEDGKRWEIAPSADETTLARTSGQPKLTSLKAGTSERH